MFRSPCNSLSSWCDPRSWLCCSRTASLAQLKTFFQRFSRIFSITKAEISLEPSAADALSASEGSRVYLKPLGDCPVVSNVAVTFQVPNPSLSMMAALAGFIRSASSSPLTPQGAWSSPKAPSSPSHCKGRCNKSPSPTLTPPVPPPSALTSTPP